MTYDQWKTDSGYSERTPEQQNEGRDCPICGGDCAGANPPVYQCPMKEPPIQGPLDRLRANIASFDAEVAFELANEGARADPWTEIDVNVEDLRVLLLAIEETARADAYRRYLHLRACNAEEEVERLRATTCPCKGTDDLCRCQNVMPRQADSRS
jgi:hypothetical protein